MVEAIRREAPRVHLYPDGGATALREALGRRLGVPPTQIVVGNGADELIGMIALAAFEPGDEIVIPTPSFEPYATRSRWPARGCARARWPATRRTWTTCGRRSRRGPRP